MPYEINAQEFYNRLKLQEKVDFCQPLETGQIECIVAFCNGKLPKTVFGKAHLVVKLIKGLVKAGLIPRVKVKFSLFGKGLASMYDRGEIVFYKQFLFSQAYLESVLTVLHEVAHVYLWSSEEYDALKECDGEFLQKFINNQSETVISPIEYYANLISISWIEQALLVSQDKERTDLIREKVELLKNKINKAKEKI